MSTELDRAAKAEALLHLLEERIAQLEKPRATLAEEMATLRDTVKRQEYRIAILVTALKEADTKIEALSRSASGV